MCVQNKAEFCPQILEVIRERLAQSLLLAEGDKLKDNFSKLPTKITIWLQSIVSLQLFLLVNIKL